jgi:hypothetical protein
MAAQPNGVLNVSSLSTREKEATAQATHRGGGGGVVTGGPSKVAKQLNNRQTIGHIINPGEITRFVHATDFA